MRQGIPRADHDREWLTARSEMGNAKRWRKPGEPEFEAAVIRMRGASAAAALRRILADSPPLTDDQRARLAAMALGTDDQSVAS